MPGYLWVKTLHVIAVVAWMAGVMYLPRLFVYHADAPKGGELSETLKVMERRLLYGIMTPALILTWAFGLAMAFWPGGGAITEGWLHVKLLLVVGLTAFHMYAARLRRAFADDANTRPAKFFRFLNEAPFVLFIGIAILAVVKPF